MNANQPKLTQQSLYIVKALKSASNGQDVFYALFHVTENNLLYMKDMIDQILAHRIESN